MELKRYGPILEPRGEIGAIFNPGVIKYRGNIILLPRVIKKGYKRKGKGFENYVSEIWVAKSKNRKFKLLRPIIKPDNLYDKYGCEDARVTKLGKEYFITYTALSSPANSGKGQRIGLASTKDFENITKCGTIGPNKNNKNGIIFPEKVKDKIVVLYKVKPNIKLRYFNNINQLKENHKSREFTIMKRKYRWESKKIGPGPPPIKTREGWLLIYHGVDENKIYRVGAGLLDLNNPQKVIARSSKPILEPERDYEKRGDVPNVVFPTGAIVKGRELFIYYGAADKYCCLASCNLDDLMNYLLN